LIPLRDSTRSNSFPIVTVLIIAFNLLVFMLELSAGSYMNNLVYIFGMVPANINNAIAITDYYPFISSLFLHGSWAHVIGNMWILWLFGDNVEDHMGKGKFFLFYILCGVIAGLAHYYTNPLSDIPVVGASGAVAGVMGAYFRMFKHAKILTYIPPIFLFSLPAWIYLGFWALSQLYYGTVDLLWSPSFGQIAFWAHVGGFLAGMILYKLFLHNKDKIYY
jgi:membrane associated rhomboid family serine protease